MTALKVVILSTQMMISPLMAITITQMTTVSIP